jgi:hypothetical protein
VLKTLASADEAAAAGEYADAVVFASMVQKSGWELPPDYLDKMQAWILTSA